MEDIFTRTLQKLTTSGRSFEAAVRQYEEPGGAISLEGVVRMVQKVLPGTSARDADHIQVRHSCGSMQGAKKGRAE